MRRGDTNRPPALDCIDDQPGGSGLSVTIGSPRLRPLAFGESSARARRRKRKCHGRILDRPFVFITDLHDGRRADPGLNGIYGVLSLENDQSQALDLVRATGLRGPWNLSEGQLVVGQRAHQQIREPVLHSGVCSCHSSLTAERDQPSPEANTDSERGSLHFRRGT